MDLLSQASSLDKESNLGSSLAFIGPGDLSELPDASGAMDTGEPTRWHTVRAQQSKKSSKIVLTVPITRGHKIL